MQQLSFDLEVEVYPGLNSDLVIRCFIYDFHNSLKANYVIV
jgi:hypothetical protein